MSVVLEVGPEVESGVMMVFLRAMAGLRAVSLGDQPTVDHRSAWEDLAVLLEATAKLPPPELTPEAVLRARKTRVPRTVKQLVSALEDDSPDPAVVSQRIADFRALSRGEAISPDRVRTLMIACTHLQRIVRAEARNLLV